MMQLIYYICVTTKLRMRAAAGEVIALLYRMSEPEADSSELRRRQLCRANNERRRPSTSERGTDTTFLIVRAFRVD
jgi:hypothetical protein